MLSPSIINPIQSSVCGLNRFGNGIPRIRLIWYAPYPGLVDIIGGSSITLTTGTVDNLISASWTFPDTTATRAIDTMLGGDALFDSADGMTPIIRYGYEWASLDNTDYLYVGYNGIAGYSDSQASNLERIIRILQVPTMMLDTLLMLDNLRMVR